MGAEHQERTRPSPTVLQPPMQWLVVGAVVAGGFVYVGWGRWSTATLGYVVLVWAAHTGRTSGLSDAATRWWTASAVTAALGAVSSVTSWGRGGWVVATEICLICALAAALCALAASTQDVGLEVARRWSPVARLVWPAGVLAAAAEAYAWDVGREPAPQERGAFTEVGGVQLALPSSAWPVFLAASLPLLCVLVWSLYLFVVTYQEIRRSPEARLETIRRAEPQL